MNKSLVNQYNTHLARLNNFIHLIEMDRLLRPERFTTEPSEPESEKRYKHWKTTLHNYLATSLTAPVDGDEAALAAEFLHMFKMTLQIYSIDLFIWTVL